MLPLRSSAYILKSEPGNERSPAHFGHFPAARGSVYQLRRCETPRVDEATRLPSHGPLRDGAGSQRRGATPLLSRRIYRNGPRERAF